jgi:hypothetical protein
LFDDISDILVEYNALERLGVCLLHTHFDIYKGEILVESINREQNALSVKVHNDKDFSKTIPCMWRFVPGNNEIQKIDIVPIQYIHIQSLTEDSATMNEEDIKCFEDIGELLIARGEHLRFGVCTNRIKIPLANGNYLVESSDVTKRELSISVKNDKDFDIKQSVETSWFFKIIEDPLLIASTKCKVKGKRWCTKSTNCEQRCHEWETGRHSDRGHKRTNEHERHVQEAHYY